MDDITMPKRVIDVVAEQMDIFDGINLKIEEEILDEIDRQYIDMGNRIMSLVSIYDSISTTFEHQMLCNKIDAIIDRFYNDLYKYLIPAVQDHMESGQDNAVELMNIGEEALENFKKESKVHEMRGGTLDSNTIEQMRQHAFEQVTNISNALKSEMRLKLGELLIQKKATKTNIENTVSSVLNSNRTRAQTIAQTELSMAYNAGFLERMESYNSINIIKVKKYWYGFKFSNVTCTYCRPRIGNIYDIDDSTETLPAHVRCRCVWLPYMSDWDSPISPIFTRRADMLKRVYRPDEIYNKINKRLGIGYAEYLEPNVAVDYLAGDRSQEVKKKFDSARDRAITDTSASLDIAKADITQKMGREFNYQMKFWKEYISKAIVDKSGVNVFRDTNNAIKGIMVLPWDAQQLTEWNKLLQVVKQYT